MAEAALGKGQGSSMVGVIAAKELTEIVRDGRFKWTAMIMVVLLITALAAGWQKYVSYSATHAAAQGQTNQQWLKQGDKNPHSAAHYGNYAFKKAGALSYFDNGVEPFTGNLLFMEAHKQNLAISRPANDLSAVTRFGDLNGAMILQVLLPLLIIFLGFTAFSGERERGTLRQLISMGVSRQELLWGKSIAIATATLIVVVPAIVLGAALLAMTDIGASADNFGWRVAILAASYAGYAAIFLFLTLAVSAAAPSPRAALMVLVGFWAFAVFIGPKTAAEISKIVYPSPSLGEFQAAIKRDQVNGVDGVPTAAKFGKYVKELLVQYNVKSPPELPVYFPAIRMQKLEELDHEVFDHHYNGLRASYMAQRRLQDEIGLVAPLLPLRSISMGLSGSDLLHHDAYTRSAEEFRRNMVAKMNGYLSKAAVSLNGVSNSSNYMTADEQVFAIVPPFDYTQPSLSEVLNEYRTALLILALWLVASIAAALTAITRMRAVAA